MPIPHFHVKGLLEATSKPTLACDRQALSRVIMNVAIFRCVRGTCKAKKSRVDTVEQKIVTVAQILSHSFFFPYVLHDVFNNSSKASFIIQKGGSL